MSLISYQENPELFLNSYARHAMYPASFIMIHCALMAHRAIAQFGSAPALGAGGREFESRHSDMTKSHDEPFTNAVSSWLYLLRIGLKMAGKCDKNATNSGKTCFVRQCAPLFCMPCPISYGYIMGCYMPLLRGYRKSLYPYNPTYGGAVSDTDPIHKGMNQIHNPDTKKCQHRHKRQGGQSDGLHRSV